MTMAHLIPPLRATRNGFLVIGLVLATACDTFYHDPAASVAVPLDVTYSFADAAASASPGLAFDKADHVSVVLRNASTNAILHEEVAIFTPGAGDKRISFEVQIEGRTDARLTVRMTALGAPIFEGSSSVPLTPGQAADIEVPLTAIPAELRITGAPLSLRVGGTAQLTAVGLFATNDEIGPVQATWQAVSQNVTVSASGLVTATGPGIAEVRASFGTTTILTALASFDVVDPCALGETPILLGQVVEGTLSRADDCFANSRLSDRFSLQLSGRSIFTMTLAADGFTPFLPVYDPTVQRSGFVGPSPMIREYVFPAGTYSVRASSQESGAALDQAPEGSYSLALAPLAAPQDGCIAGGVTTAVTYGSSFGGTIQSIDCEDEFDGEPAVVRRWDGYSLRQLAGEDFTVEVFANFPFRLTQWEGGSFLKGAFNVPAGDPAVITGTAPSDGFRQFYVISDRHEGVGSYAFAIVRGGSSDPNLVVARATFPAQVPEAGVLNVSADFQNVAGPMPLAQNIVADVYIAVQPNLQGAHALLGQLSVNRQLGNLEEVNVSGSFSIPSGPLGPHYVILDLDPSNLIVERGANNLFVMGMVNIN